MRERKKILSEQDLPDVCSPQICADFLGIGRQRVYEFCRLSIERNGLPNYKIGGSRKIDKQDLLAWKKRQREQYVTGR